MTDDDWDNWAGYHATLHRMTDAADLAMLSLWRDVFEARGYGSDELREASMHLAATGSGKWRSEHLEQLLERVSHRRLVRLQMEQAELDRRHEADECKLCEASGLITVPHPHCIRNESFVHPWYVCVVACHCYRGQKKRQQNMATIAHAEEKAKANRSTDAIPTRLPTIGEWELRYPGWESLLQHREIQREAERKARQATSAEDRRRGPLAEMMRQLQTLEVQ